MITTDFRIKVVNAGNCLLCGQLISTVDCDSGVANIFYCKKCKDKMLAPLQSWIRKEGSDECETESKEV